jgi:hypothetical protein
MEIIIVPLFLVGLLYAIICHGHSRKLVAPSAATAFLAWFTVIMLTESSNPDYGSSFFFWFFGFPVYFCMSMVIGLIYKIIRQSASGRRIAFDNHDSAALEALPSASKLLGGIWKVAFWIIFSLLALTYINLVGSGEFSGIWHWLNVFATVVAIIGFYSYAYRQKIGPGYFWKVFAVFFIGWNIFIICVGWEYQKDDWIVLLILFPPNLALFLYGFQFHRTQQADVSSYEFSERSNLSEENI